MRDDPERAAPADGGAQSGAETPGRWLLVEAARRILGATDAAAIFDVLCREAARATRARGAVAAYAPGRTAWSDAVAGASVPWPQGGMPPALSSTLYGLLREVAARRAAIRFAAAERERHGVLRGLAEVPALATGAVVAAPVLSALGRADAVLVVAGAEAAQFTEVDVRALDELARCAALALGNATVLSRARADQQRLMLFAMADRDVMWSWDLVAERVWWGSETFGCPVTRAGADPLAWKIERVHPEDAERVRASLRRALSGDEDSWTDEYRVRRKDGAWVLVEDHGYLVRDLNGRAIRFAGVMRDVTDRADREQLSRLNEELAHRALHDSLTGLPNRALVLERLQRALERTRRRPGSLAVCFVDVDHFKRVNDGLGHASGDRLLVVLAQRLAATVRSTDTVARLGGDEFVVLMEGVSGAEQVEASVGRITHALQEPVAIDGRDVAVTVSVGIVVAGPAHGDAESLLRDADAAMYHAKEHGRARLEFFDAAMRARVLERLEAEEALLRALDDDQLRLVYQPQVDLDSGRIVGVEALLRWEHPERGLLAPAEFLVLAEETGRIVPIGLWVLREACRQIGAWRHAHPGLVVWVNLSSRELTRPGLVGFIRRLLAVTGTPPSSLGIEITETTLLDSDVAEGVLTALQRVGVQLAIDDFGTGYSSLSYLRRFPVDVLKIDRSFVSGLGMDAGDSAIVRAVVALAHSLGLRVIAEGVETPLQERILRGLGCDLAQGYLFGRPLAAGLLDDLLDTGAVSSQTLRAPATETA